MDQMESNETRTPTRQKTKKQLNEDALLASIESRWEDALHLNDEILARFPRDAEALNRKGRAFIELRRLNEARDAYADALRTDPANMIARRNLQRLELLFSRSDDAEPPADTTAVIPRSAVFIEEPGRTWFDELTRPADLGKLAEVSPGDQLQLAQVGDRVVIQDHDGTTLGEIAIHVGRRILDAMGRGHLFEVYALGLTSATLRVVVRETHRPDDAGAMPTFERQDFASQDLMREREQLFLREEGDFDFGEDEEAEEVDDEADDAGADDQDGADFDSSDLDDEDDDEM